MSDASTQEMSNSPPPTPARAPVALVWIVLGIAWGAFLLPWTGSGLLIGWPLNLVAFCLAIVIMVRGRTIAGLLALAASVVVSPLVYLLGLLLLMVTAAFSDIEIDIQESGPLREHHAPPSLPSSPALPSPPSLPMETPSSPSLPSLPPRETPSLQMTTLSPPRVHAEASVTGRLGAWYRA